MKRRLPRDDDDRTRKRLHLDEAAPSVFNLVAGFPVPDLGVEILASALTMPSPGWASTAWLNLKRMNKFWHACWVLALKRVLGARYQALLARIRAWRASGFDENLLCDLLVELDRDTLHIDQRAFLHWVRLTFRDEDTAPPPPTYMRTWQYWLLVDGRITSEDKPERWQRHVQGILKGNGPKPIIPVLFKFADCDLHASDALDRLLVCHVPAEQLAALAALYLRHTLCQSLWVLSGETIHRWFLDAIATIRLGAAFVDKALICLDERPENPWESPQVDDVRHKLVSLWFKEKAHYYNILLLTR